MGNDPDNKRDPMLDARSNWKFTPEERVAANAKHKEAGLPSVEEIEAQLNALKVEAKIRREKDKAASEAKAAEIKANFPGLGTGPGEGVRPKGKKVPESIIDQNPTAFGKNVKEFIVNTEEVKNRAQEQQSQLDAQRTMNVKPLPAEPTVDGRLAIKKDGILTRAIKFFKGGK